MRLRSTTLIVSSVLLPSLAAARPITVGASLGEAQSEAESNVNQGPDETYAAFVRVGLTRYLSVQLEVARIDSDPAYDVRTATLFGVIDLGNGWTSARLSGRFVPMLLVGGGEAWGSSSETSTDSYGLDLEAGLGLEYRAWRGLVVGIDARIGQRWIQTQAQFNGYSGGGGGGGGVCCGGGVPASEDEGLYDGQFRSMRVTVGYRF
jgi:hypothetical protein